MELPSTRLFVKVQPLTTRFAPPNFITAPPLPLLEVTLFPVKSEFEIDNVLFVTAEMKTAPPPLDGSAQLLLVKVQLAIWHVPVLGLWES